MCYDFMDEGVGCNLLVPSYLLSSNKYKSR